MDKEERYHFIQGNSLEVKWDKQIDFLFIDSGHAYDLTLKEMDKYLPFVVEKGIVCMHDTGEFNNVFFDCRKAMLDYVGKNPVWNYRTLSNQNGLSILRRKI